ncbi:hypothetical protein ACN082_09885 [Rothia sp. CCM 9417]|uniref:hypothetical protein n=1 Tax=unclassified Rothia (in: high G+C Gram-positive bacteria) TaxID=2689056 RepID=UPI003AC715ED
MSDRVPDRVKAAVFTSIAKAIDLNPILWEDHDHLTEDEYFQAGEEMKRWEEIFDGLAESHKHAPAEGAE